MSETSTKIDATGPQVYNSRIIKYLTKLESTKKCAGVCKTAKFFPFTDIMRHAGFIELVPIHKRSKHGNIIPYSIKSYIGANSQTYFDFISFFQTWLIFPTIVGLITILFNYFG